MTEQPATPDELIDRCLRVIASKRRPGAVIYMVVSKGRLPRGFPRGEVVCVTEQQAKTGTRAMVFPALRVLAWALQEREAEGREVQP